MNKSSISFKDLKPDYFWFIDADFRKDKNDEFEMSFVINQRRPNNSKNIKPGEAIAFIEKKYGIFKYSIVSRTNLIEIKTIKEWEDTNLNYDPYLVTDYFDAKNESVRDSLLKKGKAYILLVKHQPLLLDHDYAVNFHKKNYQGSIHTSITAKINILNNKPDQILSASSNDEVYSNISNPSRLKVAKIWGRMITSQNDIDHIIPKSINGPGVILENLVPMESKLNRAKSNNISHNLVQVANKWSNLGRISINIPKNISENWDAFIHRGNKFNIQKQFSIEIVNEIRKLRLNLQRRFYWEVRDLEYHEENFKVLYKNAGISISFLSSKD